MIVCIRAADIGAIAVQTIDMQYDPVQLKDLQHRATGFVALALSNDTYLTADPIATMRARGFPHFAKAAVDPLTSTHDALEFANALQGAFIGAVDVQSLIEPLRSAGARSAPLQPGSARWLVGTITASQVGEAEAKPVSEVDLAASGPPLKAAAVVVLTAEAARSTSPAMQAGIREAVVSAVSSEVDNLLVAALTGGSAAASADPGVLLAAVSGGRPRRPVLLGGFDSLLAIDGATLRALRDLGVTILPTPAAGTNLIALDASGILLSDGGAQLSIARHASLALDDAGSGDPVFNLWQKNCIGIRAERLFNISARPDAIAFASTGS